MTDANVEPDADNPDETALDDAAMNRRYWDGYAAEYQRDHGPQLSGGWRWGTFSVPEEQVGALGPRADLAGADVLELGCGAAQWSIALARSASPLSAG